MTTGAFRSALRATHRGLGHDRGISYLRVMPWSDEYSFGDEFVDLRGDPSKRVLSSMSSVSSSQLATGCMDATGRSSLERSLKTK